MKPNINRSLIALAIPTILASLPVEAANTFYDPGDLVLYFQKEGSTNTVYANLGSAANLYRGAEAGIGGGDYTLHKTDILNLNSTLTSAFGAGWAGDASLYVGLAGAWSNTTGSSLLDGDPGRTLYVSSARDSISTATIGSAGSVGWDMTLAGNTAMTSAASGVIQQNNAFENNYDSQVTVSLTSVSQIDEQNPVSGGIQGNAFNNSFAGGVQQRGTTGNFGLVDGVGNVEFALDLYRILARSSGGSGAGQTFVSGQIDGLQRQGTFEGTVVIGSNGSVSFLVPEPSSALLGGLAAGAFILRRRRLA